MNIVVEGTYSSLRTAGTAAAAAAVFPLHFWIIVVLFLSFSYSFVLIWPISVNVYCVSNRIIHGTLNGIALEIHNTVFVLSSLFCQRYKRLCRVYYDKQLNRTPFAILANVEWANNRDEERISAFNRVNRAFGSERQLIYPKFELNEPNGMAHTHSRMHM